jgi:hypothetical protein
MNVPLADSHWSFRIDGVAVEVVFDDIGGRDEPRCEIARLEKVIRPLKAAHADVAEAIEDAFVRQDSIRDHEIVDKRSVSHRWRFSGLAGDRMDGHQRGGGNNGRKPKSGSHGTSAIRATRAGSV